MKVYRLCREKEVSDILDNADFKDIGRYWMNVKFLNTHTYLEKERYLHFFYRKEDVFRLYANIGLYICTYDIPDELGEMFTGTGIYHRLDNYQELENVPECAIPSKYLSFENVEEIDYIDEFIEQEDYLNGMYDTFVTPIYRKEEKIKKIG